MHITLHVEVRRSSHEANGMGVLCTVHTAGNAGMMLGTPLEVRFLRISNMPTHSGLTAPSKASAHAIRYMLLLARLSVTHALFCIFKKPRKNPSFVVRVRQTMMKSSSSPW